MHRGATEEEFEKWNNIPIIQTGILFQFDITFNFTGYLKLWGYYELNHAIKNGTRNLTKKSI